MKNTKRLLSVILTAAMVAGGVPQPAGIVLANEVNNETELSTEFETESKIEAEEETEKKSEIESETFKQEESDLEVITEETTESETKEITTEETSESEIKEITTEEITESETEEITTEETSESETEEIITEETTESETEEITTEEDILSISSSEDFVISDGILTAYTGTSADVVIPDTVKSIAKNVFKNNTTIKNITFPDSLLTIGESAFEGCSSLHSINMNEGLVEIGVRAFYDCGFGCEDNGERIYGKITIPSTVQTIGRGAFKSFNYLEEVTFLNGENEALVINSDSGYPHNYTFGDCTELKKVVLPERLKTISTCMFIANTNLTEVIFGNKVEVIGSDAFNGNINLQKIDLPASVITIESGAFSGCTGIRSVSLKEGIITIGDLAFLDCSFGCEDNGERIYGKITIPSTVQTIGRGAFKSFDYLEEVVFSNGENAALTINSDNGYPHNYTFGDCMELKRVELPERLKVIPSCMFISNKNLVEVIFGNKVETIGSDAFNGNTSLQKIDLPSAVTTIESGAFRDCTGLRSVSLKEGIITIGDLAFYDCGFGCEDNGKRIYGKITIPSTVQTIGRGAFKSFDYLEEVTFSNGQNAALTINSDNGYPYYYTFGDCMELKKVELPERLKVIPSCMFISNKNLTEVIIGNKVETIGTDAFNGNTSLQKIDLPSTVITIESGAFRYCTGLRSVSLKEGIITIGDLAFYDCGFGCEDNGERIYGKITIPSTVQTIGRGAFKSFDYLEEVTFSNGENAALTINSDNGYPYYYTFGDCMELKKVELPERLKAIPSCMFISNKNLTEVFFGNKVETIGTDAFNGNTSLQKIDLPSTVITIESGAFRDCTGLKSVSLKEGIITIGDLAFCGCAFGKDDKGKKIKGKITIPSTVRTIGRGAFKGFSGLEKLAFENGETAVLTINTDSGYPYYYAFGDCESLKHVYLPDRLEKISTVTFINNANLTALLIPETVTDIEANAIQDCPKLTIYGVKGSAAEKYAKNNNIPFKDKSLLKMDDEDDSQESKENAPKLDTNTVTMNINEENPSGILHIYPADGYEVDESSLKLTGDELFEIKKAENTSTRYTINVKSGKNVTKGKYKVVLELKTTAKEEKPYKLPLTINVVQTIPAVTVSQQSAVNIYEKDSTGELCVTSDAAIKNIKFVSSGGSSEPRLVQKDINPEEGTLTYKLENVTGKKYKNVVAKGRLVVEFEGYKASAVYSKDITLKINKKLPTYTAESLTMFIDTELNNATVKVISSADKKTVKISEGYKISIGQTLPACYQVKNQTENTPLKISVINGAKSTTLKLLVTNSNWIDDLSIPVNFKVTIGKKPVLTFSNNAITLNTSYNSGSYKAIETVPYVKGFYDFTFNTIEFTGKNAKSKEVYNNGALSLKYTDNVIKAEIAESNYFSKKATYTYDVKAVTSQGLTVNGTLKVSVATAAPQLSMKASGSIDLLDRENTCIKYKASVKNYTGEIENVQLVGNNSENFEVTYNDGVVVLKAKTGKSLSINRQYVLTVKAGLTNGAEIQGNVKFKLKQKTPKLTANVKKITMHKSVPGNIYGYQIAIKNIKGSKIESVELVDGFDTFAYDYKSSGKGKLYVLNDAQGKINKTYKLKFKVTLKDAAENAKPVEVTVQVKYVR